ncbi:NAD-dependent epimerase/dehydratase family protein [Brevundimonas sp. 3P9-tot-E]|uniref:UDP-2-acetamido-2,6-beta-L-arabino-hexul-4-ose reductase n=1 Tax=Brevundimonas sp. 3P9-tot-E TaxID=3132282 RepID=UPI0039A1E0A3
MAVVVTGASGFIGRNLIVRLRERKLDIIALGSDATESAWRQAAEQADFVFHLAGVNRPQDDAEFISGNTDVTRTLCRMLEDAGKTTPIVYASSIQAERHNAYGRSKRAAENILLEHSYRTGSPVRIFRLANVFGKWARPNYNSAVATFSHNIAHGLEITVHDANASLSLVHVDDVCAAFVELLESPITGADFIEARPVYSTTVGEIAESIRSYARSRETLVTDRVGQGLQRALYSTYLSYLEPDAFAYDVPRHANSRGVFVEMLKTPDCGQFSYFTAGPGITRGEHYHHAKTEKFLVLTGTARFSFRHILTHQRHEIITEGGQGRIVETIPGWTHDITNIGSTEMVVMLWANEIFDRSRPDTIAEKV